MSNDLRFRLYYLIGACSLSLRELSVTNIFVKGAVIRLGSRSLPTILKFDALHIRRNRIHKIAFGGRMDRRVVQSLIL